MNSIYTLALTLLLITPSVFALRCPVVPHLAYLSDNSGVVAEIDPISGSYTPRLSGYIFYDIAVSSDNQIFVGATYDQYLMRINANDWTVSTIGPLVNFVNGLGFANNGDLYGLGANSFYSVNLNTGAASIIVTIPGMDSSGDIVYYSPTGEFLATSYGAATDVLYAIKPDGSYRIVGNIGFSNVKGLLNYGDNVYGYTLLGEQIVINVNSAPGNLGNLDKTFPTGNGISGATSTY